MRCSCLREPVSYIGACRTGILTLAHMPQLTDLPGAAHVDSWSPDGKVLAFHHHAPGEAPNEILTIASEDPAAKPQLLVQGRFAVPEGRERRSHGAPIGRKDTRRSGRRERRRHLRRPELVRGVAVTVTRQMKMLLAVSR